jgi:hypothetical protein
MDCGDTLLNAQVFILLLLCEVKLRVLLVAFTIHKYPPIPMVILM